MSRYAPLKAYTQDTPIMTKHEAAGLEPVPPTYRNDPFVTGSVKKGNALWAELETHYAPPRSPPRISPPSAPSMMTALDDKAHRHPLRAGEGQAQ